MSSDVYFQRDLAQALRATYEGKIQTLAMFGDGPHAVQYHAGVRDTIAALAILWGISPAMVIPRVADVVQIASDNRA